MIWTKLEQKKFWIEIIKSKIYKDKVCVGLYMNPLNKLISWFGRILKPNNGDYVLKLGKDPCNNRLWQFA